MSLSPFLLFTVQLRVTRRFPLDPPRAPCYKERTGGETMLELNYRVNETWRGQQLSRILRKELGFSALRLKSLRSAQDSVLLDGHTVPLYLRPAQGQLLTVRLPEDPPSPVEPVEGQLHLLYEDPHLVVVDKPSGMATHPGPGHHGDTLGNLLTWHYQHQGEHHLFRPVTRLDRSTSGLVCVAKHAHAAERLGRALEAGRFRKVYLAVCEGIPERLRGTVDAPIGRREGSVLAREVRPDGKRAVTHYEALGGYRGRCLLRITPETGRTHQIRVHMAWLGHPLTGDFLYGTEVPELIPRAALHAYTLEFEHPITGQRLAFQAPLPEDMERLMSNES